MTNKMWITRDGVEVSIKKMSTDHLLNAVAMLLRKSKEGVVIEHSFDWGDADFETSILFGKEYLDKTKYKELTKELKRRNL